MVIRYRVQHPVIPVQAGMTTKESSRAL